MTSDAALPNDDQRQSERWEAWEETSVRHRKNYPAQRAKGFPIATFAFNSGGGIWVEEGIAGDLRAVLQRQSN
jgi:hypothetical protein